MKNSLRFVRRTVGCTLLGLLCLTRPTLAQGAGEAPASNNGITWWSPPAPSPLTSLSPFGIGGDAHTGRDLTKWMPQMAAIGIHAMRCASIEDYPTQMDYLDGLKIKYGALLYGVPPGDTLDAPGSLPVKDLAGWSAFVTKEVKLGKGRPQYWELWNEPPNGIGPGQTAEDYAKLLVSTYDAVKAVEPNAPVAMCAKSVHVNWLDQTIAAGGKDHFDCIVLHPYESLGISVEHPGTEPVFMSIVPTVRKMLAAKDPAKVGVPIIFTELGFDASKGPDQQAYALVKAYTMGIAQGVTCLEWFEGMDGDSGPMGLLQANGTPRPAYKAMAQMIKYLGQHPDYLGWVLLNGKDYGFVFQGANGPVLITWAPLGTKDDVRLNWRATIVDPLTGNSDDTSMTTLTEAPVIIDGVPDAAVKLAQSNKTKPFPWGGDYTNAKSVSVTYGQTNVEKGLHTQSATSIAADVLAYGGSSRAGGVPGGTVFMVDPNFLTYSSTPIEISVVVRRNQANDNAGFKLVYESTTGYKNLGWYTVPDNAEWHTMTWKITDEQFVDMWGYNFSLDSDGNQYNKYDIQSVTVTKVAP
jgi:hypothetical protein